MNQRKFKYKLGRNCLTSVNFYQPTTYSNTKLAGTEEISINSLVTNYMILQASTLDTENLAKKAGHSTIPNDGSKNYLLEYIIVLNINPN